jgi:hypothetical protein
LFFNNNCSSKSYIDIIIVNLNFKWRDFCSTSSIAIPTHPACEDMVAWHFDPKGIFSVKSVYHVLEDNQELNCRSQHGESSSANMVAVTMMRCGERFGS